jgi:hypothetical protein
MRNRGYILALAIAAAARAADPAPGDADSLSAAKKDLAAIKANTVQPDAVIALPSLDARDLGPVPGAPQMPAPEPLPKETAPDGTKKREGTGNWLVDAMDRSAQQAKAAKQGDRSRASPLDDMVPRADERQLGDKSDRDGLLPDEKEGMQESVVNPLDSFMGGWVSTRDRDLLLNAKGEVRAGEASRPQSEVLPGVEALAAAPSDDVLAAPGGPLPGDTHGSNPYLEALESAPVAVHAFTLPEIAPQELYSPAAATEPESGSPQATRSLEDTKTFIPDFAQPSDDDKYFKQLKRF